MTQEVVTGDTPALLPLPSFSTRGLSLAFSLRLFSSFLLLLSPTMFVLTLVTHAEKL